MLYKIIILCVMAAMLYGCSKNEHTGGAQPMGPCTVIKREMLQTYPPQLQRPTAIHDAKLWRDYEFYHCKDR